MESATTASMNIKLFNVSSILIYEISVKSLHEATVSNGFLPDFQRVLSVRTAE